MSWSLFERDPLTGRRIWMSLDEGPPGKTLWRIEVPADDILAANAEAEKATHGVKFGDYVRLASVPLNVLDQSGLGTAVQMRDNRFVSKFLNDADHSKFRTSRGRA